MILYDGHDLETLFVCGDPVINIINSAPSYQDSESRNGAVVIGKRWDVSTVTFSIGVTGDAHTRREKLSTLASWLDVDEPKKLVIPDTPDWYYLAIPDGGVELTRGIGGEIGQLNFTIVEPAAYGEEKTATVPSGGSVSITVGGTFPTRPTIAASAVRNSSSLVWGVRLDEGDYIHIPTGSASAQTVAVDCDARTSTVQGSVVLPTLDSDWLELAPGTHTLRMDNGTGAATVKWRERWL